MRASWGSVPFTSIVEGRRQFRGLFRMSVMRVIAGEFRSRVLAAPRGMETRPTSDRLRETLFNVLAARMEGAVVADLLCGFGSDRD